MNKTLLFLTVVALSAGLNADRVGYVDKVILAQKSVYMHDVDKDLAEYQSKILQAFSKDRDDAQARIMQNNGLLDKEKIKLDYREKELALEINEAKADAIKIFEKDLDEAKLAVLENYNATAKVEEQLGSLVEKLPGTVYRKKNDFTEEVLKELDSRTKNRKEKTDAEKKLKEKMEKSLLLADSSKKESTKIAAVDKVEKDGDTTTITLADKGKTYTAADLKALIKKSEDAKAIIV